MSKVYIAIIGTGGVGKAFINQLASCINSGPKTLIPILISRSSSALVSKDYKELPLETWAEDLKSKAVAPLSFPEEVISYLKGAPGPVIFVDNTSSEHLANGYPEILLNGIHIVTPNKKAFSSDISLWDKINAKAYPTNPSGGYVFHESTVGAGLPILSTLKELVETGDKVKKVEGVFSGTMSYIFNTFAPTKKTDSESAFSDVVKVARDLGYTEPDPRDDLNGLDVARKVTILARLSGLNVPSPTSFPIQSLIPKPLETAASADEFLSGLKNFDGDMEKLKAEASKLGRVIRYVGKLDVIGGAVSVGLESFNDNHPIAGLTGSDNIINFYTERYGERPLVIQGAGAGAEVTAMGVLGDVIKILQRLR